MTGASSSTNEDHNPWIRNRKSTQVPLNPEGGGSSTKEGKALPGNDITIANIRGKTQALEKAEDLQPTLSLLSKVLNSKKEEGKMEKQDESSGSSGSGETGAGSGSGSDGKHHENSGAGSGSDDKQHEDSGFGGSGQGDTTLGGDRKTGASITFIKNPNYSENDDNSGLDTSSGLEESPSGLFVPPTPVKPTVPTSESSAVNQQSEDAGLFTPEQADKAAGRRSDGVVTHWRKQGYVNHVMVGYGPPGARKWKHTTGSKSGRNFDQKKTPKFGPQHRYGDKKDEDGNYLRSWGEFKGFLGEAYDGDVGALRPKQTWMDSNGKKRTEKRKFPNTDLYVLWSIAGESMKVWETRSSIKHLWPNAEECDKDIYNSARFHAEKHHKWLDEQKEDDNEAFFSAAEDGDEDSEEDGDEDGDEDSDEDSDEDGDEAGDEAGGEGNSNHTSQKKVQGTKKGKEKDANKGDQKDTKKGKEKDANKGDQKDTKRGKGKGTKKGKGKDTEEGEDDGIKKMLKYRKQWCALEGIEPQDMNSKHQAKFLRVWNSLNT